MHIKREPPSRCMYPKKKSKMRSHCLAYLRHVTMSNKNCVYQKRPTNKTSIYIYESKETYPYCLTYLMRATCHIFDACHMSKKTYVYPKNLQKRYVCKTKRDLQNRHIHKTRDAGSVFDASEACQYVKCDVYMPKENYKSDESTFPDEPEAYRA